MAFEDTRILGGLIDLTKMATKTINDLDESVSNSAKNLCFESRDQNCLGAIESSVDKASHQDVSNLEHSTNHDRVCPVFGGKKSFYCSQNNEYYSDTVSYIDEDQNRNIKNNDKCKDCLDI